VIATVIECTLITFYTKRVCTVHQVASSRNCRILCWHLVAILSGVSSSVLSRSLSASGRGPCCTLHLRNCLASFRVGLLSGCAVLGVIVAFFGREVGPYSGCMCVVVVEEVCALSSYAV
jgi:hypothetical protein